MTINTNDLRDFADTMSPEDREYLRAVASELDAVRTERNLVKQIGSLRVPITAAKDVAEAYGMRQVVIIAHDGARTHFATYGKSREEYERAAQAQGVWEKHIREFLFAEKVTPLTAASPPDASGG